ncbi:Oidioi.mRNA.OKI2018_I69.XSR.g15426.t1.cds [Oikopleura dioica]|uniref:Oidioi.mRNA.OKI2018_I69.XSR.g15426.t1.cds n=1 Tax=Oikopleura dioica TaxID=34765 RepID=A0ABN7SGW7_OIKDI|nr:Oidioi.mRNA.OKI2018_I69.XSR.g15426.t1.cds [Oikopleura dioica]
MASQQNFLGSSPLPKKRQSPGRSLQGGFFNDYDEETYFEEFQEISRRQLTNQTVSTKVPEESLFRDQAPIHCIKEEFKSKNLDNINRTDHQDGYIEEEILEEDPSILARRAEIGASESRQKYVDIFSSPSTASSIIIKNPQFKSPEMSKSNEKAEYAATRHIYNFVDALLDNPAMYDFVMDGLREVCLAEGSHHIPSFLESLLTKIPDTEGNFFFFKTRATAIMLNN